MIALPPALVLAAGLGTRVRPLTARRAKPALPVAREPLISRILKRLREQGVTDAVINLHHHPASITAVVGDGLPFRMRVRYSLEPEVLGSAGGPRHALPLIDASPFFIVNGDTLSDVDLGAMLQAHERSGAAVTMAVIANPAPAHYGGIQTDDDGRATALVSSSQWTARHREQPDTTPPWHYIGVQVVDRRVFEPLADNQPAETVRGIYRELLESDPGAIRVYVSSSPFHDIGTPADYLRTALEYAGSMRRQLIASNAAVHATARVFDTVVLERATVCERVDLARCIVCEGTDVPADYEDRDAVLAPAHWFDEAPDGNQVGPLARWPLSR